MNSIKKYVRYFSFLIKILPKTICQICQLGNWFLPPSLIVKSTSSLFNRPHSTKFQLLYYLKFEPHSIGRTVKCGQKHDQLQLVNGNGGFIWDSETFWLYFSVGLGIFFFIKLFVFDYNQCSICGKVIFSESYIYTSIKL